MKEIIKVPAERAEQLRELSIEVESRKSVIETMIQNGTNINSESFLMYQKEFQKFFAEYDAAKTQLQKDFVYANFENPKRWDLDFNTCDLTVEL